MFYISEIGLRGENGNSSIELINGLNIVYGSSNSGKSIIVECIDYAFGGKETNIALNGYDSVYVTVTHEKGKVTFSRKLNNENVTIESSNPLVQSGIYPIKKQKDKSKPYLDDCLLNLLNMEPRLDIIVSKNYKKQNFTFRTCLNSFLVKQENIIRRESPYLPLQIVAHPAYKSGLVYLWTNERFIDDNNPDEIKNARIRRSAVETYITELLQDIELRRSELEKKAKINPEEMEERICNSLKEIEDNEGELKKLIDKNRLVYKELIETDKKLTNSINLEIKYKELLSKYKADMQRLEFVIEGEYHKVGHENVLSCPFCGGALPKKEEESCVDAAAKEIINLVPKINELEELIIKLQDTIITLNNEKSKLKNEQESISKKINLEVKPLLENLKQQLSIYRQNVEDNKEAVFLLKQEDVYKKKLESLNKEKEKTPENFDIMSKYSNINFKLKEEFLRLIKKANYKNSNNVELKNFDFIIDNKEKKTQGQGYRAYLNTLALLALYNCININGVNGFPFLVIDSPIQSLVENEDMEMEDSMKYGLFDCLNENTGNKQLIIIENNFPKNIKYKNVKIIYFSKDEKTGRYGFAKGIID